MINKFVPDIEAGLAGIGDGATIMVGGFGATGRLFSGHRTGRTRLARPHHHREQTRAPIFSWTTKTDCSGEHHQSRLLLPPRAKRDARLQSEIRRVWEANFQVYGARKVWRQLRPEGIDLARCTAARLTKQMELASVIHGKPVKTTINSLAAPCPRDKGGIERNRSAAKSG